MRRHLVALAACLFCVPVLFAQIDRPPQTSPGVGSAVLLATNSIQLDRDVKVVSGDVIVNDASPGPVLGEKELSLDRGVTTPDGFRLAANGIDLDEDAVAGGDVYYNQLTLGGTVAGAHVTPLALPVFSVLPSPIDRSAGTADVVVPDNATITLDEDAYAQLIVGRAATVIFSGGGYSFTSISAARGAALRFDAASDVVVKGRVALESNVVIAPSTSSGLGPSAVALHVHGINGEDGALLSTPAAMRVGQRGRVFANVDVAGGSLIFEQEADAFGAFRARDILVGRAGRVTISNAFNAPPIANPQSVFTNGSQPLALTLTGFDPEGGSLAFSIVTPPVQGTLSPLTVLSPSSAAVTYTPATASNLPDGFVFRVRDAGGLTGDGVVSINPATGDGTPPPTTVIAEDGSVITTEETPTTLLMRGNGPSGVSLTFTIVAGTGPFHGILGPVVPGTEVPQHGATVLYTPDAGYRGPDSFDFQACGEIASTTVCDTATISIEVVEKEVPPAPGDLARDVEVTTFTDTEVLVSLGGTSLFSGPRRFTLSPKAAFLLPATIAGNVADANNDGIGDNHNNLPGSVPVFMSAGVGSIGGAGSNGTTRMHFEWDVSSFSMPTGLVSARVLLHTNRGTTDSLDTMFFAGGMDNDGLLTDADFATIGERIHDAVMPVPSLSEMPVGADGTFSFSVLDELHEAVTLGFDYFTIQGRVDESLSSGRGLQVRTTATGNEVDFVSPQLDLATPGVIAPLTYTITTLPAAGTLRDQNGTAITAVPYTLPTSRVVYTPPLGFTGAASFQFEVTDGFNIDLASATINVILSTCANNPGSCDDGRD